MNDVIKKLSHNTIMHIAAGEVIERPSSVVKELVENSIDANSKMITVEIQNGGIDYIRVLDNGKGIKQNMINMAFEPHATSKINDEKDLFNLYTLGFRGEALASIASVSNVTLITKHISENEGIKVVNEGGKIKDITPSPATTGTTIIVKDLFYNTPVRRKFLKKPSIEATYISDLMMRLILSHPDISFRYVNNGKTIFHSIGDGNLKSAISKIYNLETAEKSIYIDSCSEGLIVKGYIGVLDLEKSTRIHQTFFINERYCKSDILSNALEDACKEYVTISKFPMCILNISVPTDFVDINVHPNKLEVRFSDNNKVYNVLRDSIIEALQKVKISNSLLDNYLYDENPKIEVISNCDYIDKNIIVQNEVNKNNESNSLFEIKNIDPEIIKNNIYSSSSSFEFHDSTNDILSKNTDNIFKQESENIIVISDRINDNTSNINEINSFTKDDIENKLKFIGIIFNSFILYEYEDKMLLVDQHAAYERINFDKLLKEKSRENYSQKLLTPILIEINQIELSILNENIDDIYNSGFDIEIFDNDTIVVRAVPYVLGEPLSIKKCLHEIITNIGKESDLTYEYKKTKILQSACKHSIKAGEKIPLNIADDFVKMILKDDVKPTCPHGRPIITEITKNDLFKKFKRIQ